VPIGAVILVACPVFVIVLLFSLRYLYGDSLFDLDWPGHDLNDENDTRLLKLNLRRTDQSPINGEDRSG
jgi:hypothetical protein